MKLLNYIKTNNKPSKDSLAGLFTVGPSVERKKIIIKAIKGANEKQKHLVEEYEKKYKTSS